MTVIYMDILFLCNLLFNSVILFVMTKLAKQYVTRTRFMIGVLIATSYVLMDLYIRTFILSIILNIFIAFFIVFIMFGKRKWIKHVGLFYLLTFILGGLILAFHSFLPHIGKAASFLLFVQNMNGTETSVTMMFIGLIIFILFVRWQMNEHTRMMFQHQYTYKIKIQLNERTIETTAFLDSGNQLTDPLTNRPVMIAEEKYVKQFFDRQEWDMLQVACQTNNLNLLQGRMKQLIQMIPYQGVRGEQDVLYAIKPDKMTILHENEVYETDRLILGIQFGTLTNDESYQCLLHPDILNVHVVQMVS